MTKNMLPGLHQSRSQHPKGSDVAGRRDFIELAPHFYLSSGEFQMRARSANSLAQPYSFGRQLFA